jgi:thiamine-phosphate pyrophosphorylase
MSAALPTAGERRARLAAARLYLVCDARPGGHPLEPFLHAVLHAGVDIVQLRAKDADDETIVRAAKTFRIATREHDALFVLNDRPDLVAEVDADGVHVGQDDAPVDEAREHVGAARLVGLSTHSVAQVDAAARAGVDYFAVGPIHATPTKPGRPAIGLEAIRHAAATAAQPWFAIGGIDTANVGEVVAAGARRIVVVRALTESRDPAGTARALKEALGGVA